jgi:hypothetical protein
MSKTASDYDDWWSSERTRGYGWWSKRDFELLWMREHRRRSRKEDREPESTPPTHTIPDYVWKERPGDLRDYVRWAIDRWPHAFTPAQRQALELTYGESLSQRSAAMKAGCSRDAYRKRLAGADRALRIILFADWGLTGKRPSEVRRGKNAGRAKT